MEKRVIVVDKEKCTGCGICFTACLRKAIEIEVAEDKLKILLRYAQCDFCGECKEFCPEKAIDIGLSPEPGESPIVLFEDELFECARCGKPFAPRSLISRLKNTLSGRKWASENLDLCLDCKQSVSSQRFLESVSASHHRLSVPRKQEQLH